MDEVSDSAALVRAWVEHGRDGSEPQRPADEIWAEHLLMRSVVAAMHEEGRALLARNPLRPQFWEGVVDFIGNFVHRVHRAKEEEIFFPMLIEHGLIGSKSEAHLHSEHSHLKDLTLELCDGVNEGDWEKALRVVARYVELIASHLDSEERYLRNSVVSELPAEEWEEVRRAFDEIEDRVLAEIGRSHYLDVALSLCRDVGITPAFERNRS